MTHLETQRPVPLKVITPRGPRTIGPGHPALIVAEMSGNHNLNYNRAIQIIEEAARAGADAIKLQTYTPDTMTIDCDHEYFRVKTNNSWNGLTLHKLYQQAHTPWSWQPELKNLAEALGLLFFSTPFDPSAVQFLENLEVPLYKVASFEIGDLALLRSIGQTRKPVVVSRGLASAEEIGLALATLRDAGSPACAVLHCISSYPAQPSQMNLRTIPEIARRFGVVTGLSDHTLGTTVAVASLGLGVSVIEKHFTLSRRDGGPDADFSLEPHELKQLVSSVREAEQALGTSTFEIGEREAENLVFRRSIFAVRKIHRGEEFTESNIRIIRPGQGLAPRHWEHVLGRSASRDIDRGTPLSWELVQT